MENSIIQLPPVYEMLDGPFRGGMGEVWKVRHREWDTLLAVKQPLVEMAEDKRGLERFQQECELWISLGLHRHIVLCHYVRSLNGLPTVFAEWMDGGSLFDRIADGSLYAEAEGDLTALQLRVLDVGIQIARGMAFAHSRGLVHRDLKPANIMFSSDGTAKVTDFGLSVLHGSKDRSSGFGTPAYAAPEQQCGGAVGPRADLWSFGLLLLELCLRERLWSNSIVVPAGLDTYLANSPISVPEELQQLIRACCQPQPRLRPADFRDAEARLMACYCRLAGKGYPPDPGETGLVADSWNNRALSFLDLGRTKEAEACWEKALRADPGHMAALYNRTLYRWRAGEIDDVTTVHCLQTAYNNAPQRENAELLSRLFVELQNAKPIARLNTLFDTRFADTATFAEQDTRQLLVDKSVRTLTCAGEEAVFFFRDGTAERWNIRKNALIAALAPEAADGNDAVFLPNGGLCVACEEGLLLLDHDGKCQKHIPVPEGGVRHVCLCDGGRELLFHASRRDGEINKDYFIRLALSDGHRLSKIRFSGIDSSLFLPLKDGNELLISAGDRLLLLRLADGKIRQQFSVPGIIRSAALNREETLLAAATENEVRILSPETGTEIACLRTESFSAPAFIHGSSLLLTPGEDGRVRLWEFAAGRCLRTFPLHRGPVVAMRVTEDEDAFLSASVSDGVFLQRIPPFKEKALWKLCRIGEVTRLQEDEARFQALVEEAALRGRNRETEEALHCLRLARKVPGYGRHPAYLRLNAALGKGLKVQRLLDVWNRKSSETATRTPQITDPLCGTDHKGNILFRARFDGDVNIGAGAGRAHILHSGIRGISAAAMSADRRLLALGCLDGRLALFSAESDRLLWQCRDSGHMISRLTFDPVGDFLITGSADGSLRIRSAEDGRCLKLVTGHSTPVTALRFSPDGLMLRSDAEDGTTQIWQFDYEYSTKTEHKEEELP